MIRTFMASTALMAALVTAAFAPDASSVQTFQ